jgi:hypothetical protein
MIAGSTSLAAQEQDVRVGIRGYVDEKINIAIDDVTPTSSAAQTVANILAFDLDFSLRFNVISGRAQAGVVRTAGSVDYEAWSIFGTRYLVPATDPDVVVCAPGSGVAQFSDDRPRDLK